MIAPTVAALAAILVEFTHTTLFLGTPKAPENGKHLISQIFPAVEDSHVNEERNLFQESAMVSHLVPNVREVLVSERISLELLPSLAIVFLARMMRPTVCRTKKHKICRSIQEHKYRAGQRVSPVRNQDYDFPCMSPELVWGLSHLVEILR